MRPLELDNYQVLIAPRNGFAPLFALGSVAGAPAKPRGQRDSIRRGD
jgi:hypothetical protein